MRRAIATAVALLALLSGCNDRPTQHSYHCRDGSTVSGPAARASSCDSHGGLG